MENRYYIKIIKLIAVSLLIIIFFALKGYSKHLYQEKEYQSHWCNARNGQMEFVLNDQTRVDCLLPDMAVEVDFAKKWHECIGQALYYAKKTRRTPACLLIMENGEKDLKYLYRLRYTVYNKKKISEFKTFTIKPEQLKY